MSGLVGDSVTRHPQPTETPSRPLGQTLSRPHLGGDKLHSANLQGWSSIHNPQPLLPLLPKPLSMSLLLSWGQTRKDKPE